MVLKSTCHDNAQRFSLYRLNDVIESAFPHRLHGGLNRAERSNNNYDHLRVVLLDATEQVDTGHAGHFQIRDDEVLRIGLEKRKGCSAVRHGRSRITRLLKLELRHPAQVLFVINDKNTLSNHPSRLADLGSQTEKVMP